MKYIMKCAFVLSGPHEKPENFCTSIILNTDVHGNFLLYCPNYDPT